MGRGDCEFSRGRGIGSGFVRGKKGGRGGSRSPPRPVVTDSDQVHCNQVQSRVCTVQPHSCVW